MVKLVKYIMLTSFRNIDHLIPVKIRCSVLAKRLLRFFQNVKFDRQHMGWLLDVLPSLFHASKIIVSLNLQV
jgi:hypothetical protein